MQKKEKKKCCWSLLTFRGSHWVSCWFPPPTPVTRTPGSTTLHSRFQKMEGQSGRGERRRREGGRQGDRGIVRSSSLETRRTLTTTTTTKRKKNPLHPPHSEPCIPTSFLPFFVFPLHSVGERQTSTDWIWFICARIIWTLLRIFFWWPANVTPTLRMSL